jgi:hypothetical protein
LALCLHMYQILSSNQYALFVLILLEIPR